MKNRNVFALRAMRFALSFMGAMLFAFGVAARRSSRRKFIE